MALAELCAYAPLCLINLLLFVFSGEMHTHNSAYNLGCIRYDILTQQQGGLQLRESQTVVMESLWILQSLMIVLICFGVLLPHPMLALICYSFFDSSVMVECMDGRPDYSTDTDTDSDTQSLSKKLLTFFFLCVFFVNKLQCDGACYMSEWIWTMCSILSPMFLTAYFTQMLQDIGSHENADVQLNNHNNILCISLALTQE